VRGSNPAPPSSSPDPGAATPAPAAAPAAAPGPLSADERRALEEERDFLVRSLDDLDEELAVGNVYLDEYERLHDEYVARAAEVLRSLDHGRDERHVRPEVPRWKRVAVALGVTAFAVTTCALLARVLGERLEGETVTGNAQNDPAARQAQLEAARDANPLEAGPHLALARFLLQQSDLTHAVQEFDEAFRLDQTSAEAAAYGGWIRALVAGRVTDATQRSELYQTALDRLNLAVAADPGYADAHFFRGMTQCLGFGNATDAVAEWQRYLDLTGTTGDFASQIQGFISAPPCTAPAGPAPPDGATATTVAGAPTTVPAATTATTVVATAASAGP
jgi:tetratricopeptide (TPR) repeat protein